QLAIVIEQKKGVCVFLGRFCRGSWRDLSSHSEMHEKSGGGSVAICPSGANGAYGRKPKQHKLAVTLDGFDLPSRQMLLERRRVIDEIRFSEAHGENPPAHNRSPQA